MKVFIDTNVLLDVLQERAPHSIISKQIWALAEAGKIQGCISAISFNNIYYLVAKYANRQKAELAVEVINATFMMVPLDNAVMNKAIKAKMRDFEDSIQFFSALTADVECIITRNAKDFPKNTIPILSPEDFLAQNSF